MPITTFNSQPGFLKTTNFAQAEIVSEPQNTTCSSKVSWEKGISLIAASVSTIMKNNRADFLQTTDYTEATFLQSFSVFHALGIH